MIVALTALLLLPQAANAAAGAESSYEFATPLFGLSAARGGGLLVADAGAGVVKLQGGNGTLIAELPNITDVAPYTKRCDARGDRRGRRAGSTGSGTAW